MTNHYTVADMIKELQELDPALPVIMAGDQEGNSYSLTRGVDTGFVEELAWLMESCGHYGELTPELEAQGYTEEDIFDIPVAVVYP